MIESKSEWCSQCNKARTKSEMTHIYTGKMRRRMCMECQSKAMDRLCAARARTKSASKSVVS